MEPAGPPRPQPSAPPVQRSNPLPQGQTAPVVQKVTPPAIPEKKTSAIWPVLLTLLCLLLIGSLILIWIYINPRTGNSILIEDQRTQRSIHVSRLVVKTPSFLVIQPFDINTGTASQNLTIANSGFLTPDIYEDFDLPFVDDTLQDVIVPGTILMATLYEDSNGDRFFQFGEHDGKRGDEEPVKDLLGNIVRVEFHTK